MYINPDLTAKDGNHQNRKPIEPILFPKLRIYFADFPYFTLIYAPETAHLGHRMRITVRIILGLVNCNLARFFEASAIISHMTENCHALSPHVPIHPASGFTGKCGLNKKGNSLVRLRSGSPS
jgi:hypothetical protein